MTGIDWHAIGPTAPLVVLATRHDPVTASHKSARSSGLGYRGVIARNWLNLRGLIDPARLLQSR